jgi:RNA ligase (TIGR02306 family)
MTRKLATIQRIKDLLAIKGADRIEIAIINGWQVVTQKGQHQVGDLVIFYEIDSFLPAEDPRYASFAERFSNWGDKRGMRLKTIKLRKQLSQGLIMPVREFPEIWEMGSGAGDTSKFRLVEGDDVTEILKIEKWEPIEKDVPGRVPGSSSGKRFPSFIPKTDQERIQNYGEMVLRAIDEEFEVTVKKDGSSMTVFRVNIDSPHYADAKAMYDVRKSFWQKIKGFFIREEDKPVYGICSRNVLLPLEGNSNFHVAAQKVITALELGAYPNWLEGSIAIQGEVVAPDIQDNYEKVSEVEFHMFDLFKIDKQKYAEPWERATWAMDNDINHATVLTLGSIRDIIGFKDGDDVVKKCLDYASGPGDNTGVMREGVVFKALNRDFSFKSISNEYLLHKED